MNDFDFELPSIFTELLNNVEKRGNLSPEIIEKYRDSIANRHTFLPDLIDIIGPEVFLELILYFGGKTITLPTVKEVIKKGANNE